MNSSKTNPARLILFFDWVTSMVDGGNAVDVIYLYFSKAFDKVSHGILISKLIRYGLDRATTRWIHSWLYDRIQTVLIIAPYQTWRR